jgi:protocatechuate 3,4-dioxygenase beta subunit
METHDRARNRRYVLSLFPAALGGLIALACGVSDEEAPPQAASRTGESTATGSSASPAAATPRATTAAATQLAPTPACGDDDDDPTPAQTEGPYYSRNTPQRASLIESGMGGTRLLLEGVVRRTDCQPVARALLDFWQCDDRGQYDNAGYRLRGHQFTDDQGRFRLETIVPGLYPGRTRHIHVKVQAPNRPVLTTQLYFPGEPGNSRDGIFNAALQLEDYKDAAGGKTGRYDFVVA